MNRDQFDWPFQLSDQTYFKIRDAIRAKKISAKKGYISDTVSYSNPEMYQQRVRNCLHYIESTLQDRLLIIKGILQSEENLPADSLERLRHAFLGGER